MTAGSLNVKREHGTRNGRHAEHGTNTRHSLTGVLPHVERETQRDRGEGGERETGAVGVGQGILGGVRG